MGRRPTVIDATQLTDPSLGLVVLGDQVVFTSIQSPTGQGYRIIANSAGVRTDEKAEITRRSPSHNSLSESVIEPLGLLSYRLNSGRHCISYCCHAGFEPSARGGQRVYTYIVLLDREGFRRFDADPIRIHSLLADKVKNSGLILQNQQGLDPLALPVPESSGDEKMEISLPALPAEDDCIEAIGLALRTEHRLILVGTDNPWLFLEGTLLSLPLSVREQVDVSVGLKFSPSRQMQLVLVPDEQDAPARLLAGQDVELWKK